MGTGISGLDFCEIRRVRFCYIGPPVSLLGDIGKVRLNSPIYSVGLPENPVIHRTDRMGETPRSSLGEMDIYI